MRRARRLSRTAALALAMATLPLAALPAAAAAPLAPVPTEALVARVSQAWLAAEWERYARAFVAPEGRVVDNGNGGISHSEGQGYGLLLAAKARDAVRFETLWRWTAAHLLVREDGLAAWKWDPAAGKVADTNNATDADILMAWALWEGAKAFGRPDYRDAAARIARAVAAGTVVPGPGGASILLPGVSGFSAAERPDGPVVNLSYWVLPAFPALKDLVPGTDWAALRRNGLALLDGSRFGPFGLPTDWEQLAGGRPRPAAGFPASFGYNAVRIPLYLALDGLPDARRALRRFAGTWSRPEAGGAAARLQLASAGSAFVGLPLAEPGYDLVFALARCATGGQAVPPEALSTRSALYYPETLRLLAAIALEERYPACL